MANKMLPTATEITMGTGTIRPSPVGLVGDEVFDVFVIFRSMMPLNSNLKKQTFLGKKIF